eukprot:UN01001
MCYIFFNFSSNCSLFMKYLLSGLRLPKILVPHPISYIWKRREFLINLTSVTPFNFT